MTASKNPTTVVVVIDRSGSMEPLRGFVVEGVNALLAQLDPTDRVTLVQFDGQDPYEVLVENRPAGTVDPIKLKHYKPRASTPLFDAVGEAITRTTEQLERARVRGTRVDEDDPGVMLAIVSDGYENASCRFSGSDVRRMIDHRQRNGWRVTFVGLGIDAFAEARRLGVRQAYVSSHSHDGAGTLAAFSDMVEVAGETRRRGPVRES